MKISLGAILDWHLKRKSQKHDELKKQLEQLQAMKRDVPFSCLNQYIKKVKRLERKIGHSL